MVRQLRERDNDVNGSSLTEAAVASGRDGHSLQVVPDHHQATVGGQNRHGERVMTGRNQATARTNIVFRVATWNVNTLGQAGKFENLKKEATRMKLDIVGVSEVRWTGGG